MDVRPPIPRPADRLIPGSTGAPQSDVIVVSSDSHVMEEEHLWEERLPERLKHRAPRIWRDSDGRWHVEIQGAKVVSRSGEDASAFSEGRAGFLDQEQRLADLDAEGVDKELLFPQRTM